MWRISEIKKDFVSIWLQMFFDGRYNTKQNKKKNQDYAR